jgi:hypothetical protein
MANGIPICLLAQRNDASGTYRVIVFHQQTHEVYHVTDIEYLSEDAAFAAAFEWCEVQGFDASQAKRQLAEGRAPKQRIQ